MGHSEIASLAGKAAAKEAPKTQAAAAPKPSLGAAASRGLQGASRAASPAARNQADKVSIADDGTSDGSAKHLKAAWSSMTEGTKENPTVRRKKARPSAPTSTTARKCARSATKKTALQELPADHPGHPRTPERRRQRQRSRRARRFQRRTPPWGRASPENKFQPEGSGTTVATAKKWTKQIRAAPAAQLRTAGRPPAEDGSQRDVHVRERQAAQRRLHDLHGRGQPRPYHLPAADSGRPERFEERRLGRHHLAGNSGRGNLQRVTSPDGTVVTNDKDGNLTAEKDGKRYPAGKIPKGDALHREGPAERPSSTSSEPSTTPATKSSRTSFATWTVIRSMTHPTRAAAISWRPPKGVGAVGGQLSIINGVSDIQDGDVLAGTVSLVGGVAGTAAMGLGALGITVPGLGWVAVGAGALGMALGLFGDVEDYNRTAELQF